MKKVSKIVTCLVLATVFGANFTSALDNTPINTTTDTTVKVNVSPLLDLTADTNENFIQITPTASGAFKTSVINLTAKTNNVSGYNILMSSTSGRTALLHSDDNTYYIPTLKNDFTATAFPSNSWGFSVDANTSTASTSATYKPVTDLGHPASIRQTTAATPEIGETFPVTFGAKADLSQVAGTYVGEVIFTLIANYTPEYTYLISYNPNGGKGGPIGQTATSTMHNESFTIPDISPTRAGYTFLGWSRNASATTAEYGDGDVINLTYQSPVLTLYAIWRQNPVTLSRGRSSYANPLGEDASIDSTIEKPGSVLNVEIMISELPDPSEITMAHRAAIERVKAAYEALSNTEKALIDSELMAKYNAIIAAYYSLLNESSLDPLLVTVGVTAVAAIGAGIFVLAKKDKDEEDEEENKK